MWDKPVPPNVYDIKRLKKFIDEIGSDNCRANLDIGHCNIVAKGSPESIKEDILALKDRIAGVHVNDNDGINDLNLIPGTKSCDFHFYLNLLKSMGYRKYISVELEGIDDPVPAAKKSLEYIKKVLHEIDAYG